MQPLFVGLCYLLFFLSGAAALIYQVAWVRSLTLIFGGSHLAVTAVLSIFMAGLALGGYIIGRYADSVKKPLRLYGFLETGIALFAIIFMALMKLYPSIYIFLAQGKDNSHLYLSLIRIVFSAVALIVPTTLMGGTLPLLTRFVSRQTGKVKGYLSFLYGFNTLGAVVGAVTAGFFLLRYYSLSSTLYVAVIVNLLIGFAAVLLQARVPEIAVTGPAPPEKPAGRHDHGHAENKGLRRGKQFWKTAQEGLAAEKIPEFTPSMKIVLWGIGVSGFCALGYEVLWTRILCLFVGASVYGFTTVLAAFLSGIALGSGAYGILPERFGIRDGGARGSLLGFGLVEIGIGISALLVSMHIESLPADVVHLLTFFHNAGMDIFWVKTWANFLLAFLYMIVPAFLMGVAFPLAGKAYAEYKNRVGIAVGEVLACNTIGAILGAAVSGFVLIYIAGIERSLEILIAVNIGFGLFIISSIRKNKLLSAAAAALTAASVLFFILNQRELRLWDANYFFFYQSSVPQEFDSPKKIQERLADVDLLYYGEGVESIVSSFKAHGGYQYFLTNGRTEASTDLSDQQCQFTLGYLPMLLNRAPKNVLVVGLGSGMTLGATSVYPGVDHVTLAEIEPKVIGVAKTFAEYNHHALDNPKLKVVFNDGRNFLMTSNQKFDVITADPIHPWFRGAGYLYTSEYFKIAADHLSPGGVVCQWVPLYELTVKNIKSIVKTFSRNFKYTMMWVTFDDAELVGSNSPIIIDEDRITKAMADPVVGADLKRVGMGSAADFMSYFVMGTRGAAQFGKDGVVNTDDNLYLEFSAPLSTGKSATDVGPNLAAILKYREDIFPYTASGTNPDARDSQKRKWSFYLEAGRATDAAHVALRNGRGGTMEFVNMMAALTKKYSSYAPAVFLWQQYERELTANQGYVNVIYALADVYSNSGQIDKAIELCRTAVRANPDNAYYRNALGVAYGRKGLYEEAIEQFRAAAKLAPAEPAYRQNLDRTLMMMKSSGSTRGGAGIRKRN
jgi:spermidine synthase